MNEPLTEAELAAIRERADKATAGPWRWADWETPFGQVERDHWRDRLTLEAGPGGDAPRRHTYEDTARWILRVDEWADGLNDETRGNYSFIAHAREDVPRLLAEIARLRQAEAKGERA